MLHHKIIGILILFGSLLTSCSVFLPKPERIVEVVTATPNPAVVATEEVVELVVVVIAFQDIPAGTEIDPSMVGEVLVPLRTAPQSAITDISIVIGTYARTDIYREEMILIRKLVVNPEDSRAAYQLVSVAMASRDIQAGENITEDMVYFGYVEQSTLEELGIKSIVYNDMFWLETREAIDDIPAYQPILSSMVRLSE